MCISLQQCSKRIHVLERDVALLLNPLNQKLSFGGPFLDGHEKVEFDERFAQEKSKSHLEVIYLRIQHYFVTT